MGGMICPWCGVFAAFVVRTIWEATPADLDYPIHFGAWTCKNCRRPVTGVADDARPDDPEDYEWVPRKGSFYPMATAPKALPKDAPAAVRSDALEAFGCLEIGAWKAAVAMARRAIQAAAFSKKAPDVKLVQQIDWLEEQRLITPLLRDVAHKIRLGGNLGAHPSKDGLKEVTEQDARDVCTFLDDFLKYVYEIPARLRDIEGPTHSGFPP